MAISGTSARLTQIRSNPRQVTRESVEDQLKRTQEQRDLKRELDGLQKRQETVTRHINIMQSVHNLMMTIINAMRLN